MNAPPGSKLSSTAVGFYGRIIRSLRKFTTKSLDQEPKWRHRRPELTTGYHPTTYSAK
jgi:hydrogenase small subunit